MWLTQASCEWGNQRAGGEIHTPVRAQPTCVEWAQQVLGNESLAPPPPSDLRRVTSPPRASVSSCMKGGGEDRSFQGQHEE